MKEKENEFLFENNYVYIKIINRYRDTSNSYRMHVEWMIKISIKKKFLCKPQPHVISAAPRGILRSESAPSIGSLAA